MFGCLAFSPERGSGIGVCVILREENGGLKKVAFSQKTERRGYQVTCSPLV